MLSGYFAAIFSENLDLVVMHDGTRAAKGGGILLRETRTGTTHRGILLVVTTLMGIGGPY
jgi:hypothetical protein